MATYFEAIVSDDGVVCRTVEEDIETSSVDLDVYDQVPQFHILATEFVRRYRDYKLIDTYEPLRYVIEVTDDIVSPFALLDYLNDPLSDYAGSHLESY